MESDQKAASGLAGLGNPKTVFRTYDASGKYTRLRNYPQIRLTPSTFRGKPTGPVLQARARRLDGAEADHARSLLAARFPVLHARMVPWMHRRKGWKTIHYEVTAD
jgi:PPOX class probable F420-dependent enzyme